MVSSADGAGGEVGEPAPVVGAAAAEGEAAANGEATPEAGAAGADAAAGPWRGPLAALIAGLALVYLPLWLGQVFFFRDVGRWLYPARVFLHGSLAAGQSPLYNPHEGLGLPLAASPLYGLFYPGSWLPAWHSEARALSLGLFLHLVWGAVGMLLLARRFGLGAAGALVAAFGWALSGPVTASGSAGQLLAAAAWFPWCGLGAVALAARLTSRRRLLVGIALAALPPAAGLLLGEVFQAGLGVLFGGVVGLAWAWPRLDRPAARRALVAVPAALLLAGLLAAPTLAPLSAALGETERSGGLARQVAEQWSLHPLRLTELVAPQAMGNPYGSYPGGRWAGDGAFDDRPLIYSVYLGVGLLLLALVGLGGGSRAASWGLGSLALLALLLALGRHTPVHAAFRAVLPLFAFQRAPEKYVLLLVPPLALLAGLGAARALAAPRALILNGLAVALALALLVAVPIVSPAAVAGTISRGAGQALVVVAVMVALAFLVRHRPGARAPLGIVIAAVCVLDVARAALPLLVFGPAGMLDAPPPVAQLIARDHGARAARPRVVRDPTVESRIGRLVQPGQIVRHEALGYATLRPSFLTAHGLANIPGYDAGLPPALEALWLAGERRALALMRLLAVDHVVLGFQGERPLPLPGLQLVGAPGPPGVGVHRVTHARPRVYVAERIEWLPASAAGAGAPDLFARLLEGEASGARVDLIEGIPTAAETAASDGPSGGPPSTCQLLSLDHTRIEARCRLSRPGQVVFVEQHGAGWRATVDGAPAPIRRANLVMRAVPVPAGERKVVLDYHPPRLSAGLAAAALGLAFVLGALLSGVAAGRSGATRPGQAGR